VPPPQGHAPAAGPRRLGRLRFTLALELALLGTALLLGLFEPGAGAGFRERFGFGWASLRDGRPETLAVSTFLCEGFPQWLRIAWICALGAAPLELRLGSGWALLCFVLTNALGALGAALIQGGVALYAPDTAFAREIDVGASAGAYGCMGCWMQLLPPPWRRRAQACALLYLALKPLLVPMPLSDATHALAWLLGLALGHLLARGHGPAAAP
jgi:hypothetical protein